MAKWIGLKEWNRRVERLPPAVQQHIMRANETSATELAAMISRLAPRRTGQTSRAVAVVRPGQRVPPYGKIPRATVAGATSFIVAVGNADVWHVHILEFGAKPHRMIGGRFPGTMHPGVRPRPYVYPSWRAMKKQIRRRGRTAMRNGVRATKR